MFLFNINAVKEKFTPQAFKDMVTSSLLDQLGSTPRWNYGWDGKGNTTTISIDTPITNTETLNKIAEIVNKQLHKPHGKMEGAPSDWGITFVASNGEVATFSVAFEVPKLSSKGTTGGVSGTKEKTAAPARGFLPEVISVNMSTFLEKLQTMPGASEHAEFMMWMERIVGDILNAMNIENSKESKAALNKILSKQLSEYVDNETVTMMSQAGVSYSIQDLFVECDRKTGTAQLDIGILQELFNLLPQSKKTDYITVAGSTTHYDQNLQREVPDFIKVVNAIWTWKSFYNIIENSK